MTYALFVEKTSNTFADPLLAFGLGAVVLDTLRRASPALEPSVLLQDAGTCYRIECTPAPDDACLESMCGPYTPAAFLRTAKNEKPVPTDLPPLSTVDYDEERERRAEFFRLREALPAEAQKALKRGLQHPALEALRGLEPHEHWDVFRAINPQALAGYNKLMAQWWTVQPALPKVLALLRDLFAQLPNDVDAAVSRWKALDREYGWKIPPLATAGQIFNPSQGKGQNRPKADRLQTPGGNMDGFWLLEWLKAVGFYHAALTKLLSGKDRTSKDRKTYVLSPSLLGMEESDAIMAGFRGRMVRTETATRSDVLTSLRYCQALLALAQQPEGTSLRARLFSVTRPRRLVGGFQTAFYKDLGQSPATMNLSFIGLPGWVEVARDEDLVAAQSMLAEHERIVRQFDESHSDDYGLLLRYRDFLSGTDLWPFLDFTTAYSGYLIGKRERSPRRIWQFDAENLRRLIVSMEPKLTEILEKPGFQRIAYAIRQSTVVAQYHKQQGDRRYDVRYGLGQELARRASYPAEFVAALSDFLHRYNAENAQVMEARRGPFRKSVRTTDIDDIVALVDMYGAPLVCGLLVAYGYARTPREVEAGGPPPGEDVEEGDETDEAADTGGEDETE